MTMVTRAATTRMATASTGITTITRTTTRMTTT